MDARRKGKQKKDSSPQARKPRKRGGRAATSFEMLEPRVMLSVSADARQDASINVASTLRAGPEMAQTAWELIVVDPALARQGLVPANPSSSTRVLLLDEQADVFAQISKALSETGNVRTLHILTHGAAGELKVGDQVVDAEALSSHASEIANWSKSMAPDAVIALYGCDVAQGESGRAFVQALAKRTGATVAASDDLTGAASRGGDWKLEYVVGDDAAQTLRFGAFDGLLATFTVTASAGTTTHIVGSGAGVIDSGLTVASSDGVATYTSATVTVSSGFRTGEDVLDLPSAPAGFTSSFNATTGVLTVSAAGGKTAAQFQSALRLVTYENTQTPFANTSTRGVTFTFQSVSSSAKSVTPDLPVDQKIKDRIQDAFNVIDNIGQAIANANAQPYRNNTTEVPVIGDRITDLLYPNSETLNNGSPVPDLDRTIQPAEIGNYIRLGSTVSTYFAGAGTITNLNGLKSALEAKLAQLVEGNQAVLQVDAAFTKPTSTDARRIDLTVTILSVKGDTRQLTLETIERDLNLRLGSGATVQTGGGADIAFTISLDLAGHEYGGATAVPAANVGIDFTRFNAFAGYALDSETFDVEVGAIRGSVTGASGYLGARIPVSLGASGNTRTLAGWATNGSDYAGFGTLTGVASVALPISASIGGVSATTANTKILLSDSNLFDSTPPTYSATDYDKLQYFASIKIDDVIGQILKVGDLFNGLTHSGTGQFGVEVPLFDSTTLGELFDFKTLFDSKIGQYVNIFEPILNTPGRDALVDYRLPLSEDTTPKPSQYSDLRSEFTFGVVLNDEWPVHTVTVAADSGRTTLADLIVDVNAALTSAGIAIQASNVKNKMSLKATNVSVQRFAIVPVAPDAARLSPTAPASDLSAIALNTPQYYTVTGNKDAGAVTGTNYYTVGSNLAAAVVHAGILANGETGVVKVTRVGATGILLGSVRNGVTSSEVASSTNAYLVESAVSDIRKLGIVDYASELTVLEQFNNGSIRATLPLQANLPGSVSFRILNGSDEYLINIGDNSRTDLLDTVGDVNHALSNANLGPSTLRARLVDAAGNVVEEPEASTDYYLQLYLPEGSGWSDFSLAPATDATAHMVLPLGFVAGDVAARPRPAALTTFQDFTSNALFPDITITPLYDAAAGTVTIEFSASNSATPSVKAAFDFTMGKLGKLVADNTNLTFTPSVTSELAFGLQFKIGPEQPVAIASGTTVPANGRLTSTGDFNVEFVLDDKYAVSIPQGWTTANNNIQDLISDINRALMQTTNGASGSEDITDRFIARRLQDLSQFELTTATKANAGSAYTITHTNGVLDDDLEVNFWHDGTGYTVTLAAADTEDNTSFADLLVQLNAALGTAETSTGETATLTGSMFFTTIATAAGASDSKVYLYATSPADDQWPSTVVITADRTDPAVTQLGLDDGGESTVSTVTARAGTGDATLVPHSSGDPLASGTIDLSLPSFTGSVPYGFNTLAFTNVSGGVTAKATVDLNGSDSTADQVASDMAGNLTQTLTRANGTGKPRATLILEDLTSPGNTIDDDATVQILVSDFSDTTEVVDEPIGVPIPIPGQLNGVLTQDRALNFLHDGARYTLTVTAASTSGNTTFAQLAAQYNAKLATAQKTLNGVTTTVDARNLFTIGADPDSAGQVIVYAATTTANPDFASVTFNPDIDAFGSIAAQGSFGLSTVADSLIDVIPLLDAIQSDMDLFSAFKLPLIDTSVNELIDIKGELLNKVESLRNISISSPSQIAAAVAQALGIPNNYVGVMYDDAANAYRIDLQWETGVATAKALDLTLADFYRFTGEEPPMGLASFNDAGSSSPLEIKIKAITTLALGIDLSDPDEPRTFLYGHDGTDDHILSDGTANGTSVELQVEAKAEDINFTAALGAFGIFVKGGTAQLGGAAREFNGEPIYTFDDDTKQLHFARDNSAAVLSVTLGEVGEKYYLDPEPTEEDATNLRNYETGFNGTVEANLPIFTPTEFMNPFTNRQVTVRIEGQAAPVTVTPGGNIFQLLVGDLQAYADASLNLIDWQRQIADVYADADGDPLTNPQQEVVDDLQTLIDGLKESDVLEIYTPDVDDANSGVRAPTLLDLVRDPAILVDGIDVGLGAIETGLRALDNLNIPVIGSVLGDAVDGVFDWRRGWLLDLKHDLRGQGEAFFESLKDNVYDFLGPAGLDILLKDNGVRSVEGMIKADSKDDITLDFLDEDGEKLTGLGGYGAEAFEFKVRLGQVLLDTGTDISFNFDSLQPALSLAIKGGLTFKLGWDMTIGFGVSMKDGFYMVTDSDPVANELELRFEAGLSGAQTGFTVAERSGSITGYSIKDAGGSWVRGPRKGDGSSDILDVMPVDENGNDYDFGLGLPIFPEDCAAEVAAGDPSAVYWVVAIADEYGDPQPAYLDKLGQYRAMAGDTWSDLNGGDDERNPDVMVQYNQTAPFAAYGSLFAFNLSAIDNIKMGLGPVGDAEYYYNGSEPQITSGQRNDSDNGVNRNNQMPTRIAGRIAVNISDPSAGAEDYVARPGPTATGFMLMDGANAFGGEPVLDDSGQLIPVRMVGNDWYVMEPEDANDPSSDLVEAFLINEDQSPNRITFSEFQEAGTSIFELKLNAEAVVNLKLTLTVSENANIPRITAELNIDWRTDSMKPPANPFATETEQKRDLIPEVGVNNIRLDLGAFLTKFIKPIATKVDSTMKPLDPLIDALMTSIPVLSDIAGRPIRLTTLLSTFGGPKGQAVATMLEMVVLVRQLSGVMAAVPSDVNVYLPIGNFWLAKVGAGPTGQPGMGTQIYYDNSEVTAPSITQRNQSMIANSGQALNSVTNALGKLDQMDRGSSSQPGVASQDRGGFAIPILQDPMTVFKLIMGQNVPLVTFSLPKLDFNFNTSIPLVRIVCFEVGIRFGLQMKGQLAMGYDTYGLRLFKDSHDPQDLLEGFYVSDRANADGSGADVDEFYLRANIALYGEIDLYLAKGGIEGGFNFTATINLNDPDNDGKVRVMEAVELVKYTGNPLDLADLHFSGEVYARYYWWVGLKIWTPWKTYKVTLASGGKTFARLQLFSFTREGRDGPPSVAAKVTTITEDGTEYPSSLLLNVGPNSAKRISNEDPLKLKDAAERVKIWNNAGDLSTVYVQYLNYSSSYTKSFSGISRVVVHGGEGNDSIDASGLNGIPIEFDGGAGNDTIYLGSGSSSVESLVKGGLGNDVIRVTAGGRVRMEGDEGNDDIEAGTGSATINGGGGADTITGGSGDNVIDFSRSFGKDNLVLNSAALVNLLNFIDSSLPVTGELKSANSTIKAGDTNSATFDFSKVTEIRGSDGRDTFNVTDPTTRSANGGKGVVLSGGPSDDVYNINANDTSAMNADGITIDDDIEPLSEATVGDVEVDDCGHLKKIKIDDPGLGYVQPPDVIITDSTGTGARAVASLDKNGKVTGIYVLAKGDNYSANPTVTLVRNISTGDKINFNSQTHNTVTLDQQGNGAHDHRIRVGGMPFKWVGYEDQGTVREVTHDVNEIDRLSITLPNAKLEINEAIDLTDKFEVKAKEFDQRAPITADTVNITTDRGFAADYPINATNNGDVVLRVTGAVDANDITTQATARATVVGGVITGFTILNGGSGYKFAPTISIEDPRGAHARATTTITNGVVTGITLIDGGTGYLSTPAPVVTIAEPDSIQLNNNLSSSTVGSLPGDGDGRGTVTLRAEAGAINQSGDVFFPTGSNVLWERGDYRYTSSNKLDEITPTAYAATTGGSGATAVAVLDSDGRVTAINVVNGGTGYSREFLPSVEIQGAATATAIVNNGAITGFKITYPGEGYAIAPQVRIVSNGFGKIVGADADATALNRKHIKSAGGSLIAVAYSGIGSASKPLKTDVENMVAQTFDNGSAIYVLEKDGVRIGLMDHINGVNTVDGDIGVTTFGGTISLGQPVQQMNASGQLLWQDANKTIPIYARDENGKIIYKGGRLQSGTGDISLTADDIDINSYVSATGGRLTVQPVQPDAKIGLNGTRARATAALVNGQVTGVSELWSGRGYTSLPLVTIAAPGERAFGIANVLNGQLKNINVTFGGKGYNAQFPPTITLVGGGLNGANATTPATVVPIYDANGTVTGVTISNGGAGYYTAPEVRFALPGVQATATAQVINGRVSEIQIMNPGSNYSAPPEITIEAPYAFSLEKEEVDYLQQGFENIVIGRADGRHVFDSANAGFVDGVTLRGPRAGGAIQMENIRSNDGPIVIIGSGHTLNLTTVSPDVTGTFVEIDDNVVVHDDVNAVITGTTSYVSIFGAGKGKIDGVAGSDDENLTINDVGNVLITGAIGSTYPINDLTINSSGAGTINLQSTVTLEGDLHIVEGGDIAFGNNLVIGGDLIIDEGASVSFAGTVTVTGDLIIRKATTVSFAKNVSVTGDVAIGEPNDPSKIEGVNFASTARLDCAGGIEIYTTDDIVFGNRIGQLTAPAYITLRSDLGDISFQASVNVPAGAITLVQARDITFAQELTADSLDIQNATGQTRFERATVLGSMMVTSTSLVQIKNRLDITTGSATLVTNDVDFAGGNGSINYTGNGISTLTIRPRTSTRDITIGSPPGVFSALDISDVDLAAIGATFTELAIGSSATGTGIVTIGSIGSQQGAGNSQLVTSTRIYGGTINVVQAIDSAAEDGYIKMVARTGNININARINGTAAERNAEIELQTLAGAININQPIHATDELRIFSFGAVTEGASGYVDVPNLGVTAGGAVTMNHASNSISALAIDAGSNEVQFRNDTAFAIGTVDVVSGVNSGTADTILTSVGGTITQTQPITAAGLKLAGTGATWTLNHAANNITTLAADTGAVSYRDADSVVVGTVAGKNGIATSGATTIIAASAITLSRAIITTTGNIAIDANGGDVTANSNGDLAAGATGTVWVQASGNITLSDVTSGGTFGADAGVDFTLNDDVVAGGAVTIDASTGHFAQATGSSIGSGGAVGITAAQSITTRDIAAAGNLTATAGTGISAQNALSTTAGGNVSLTAQSGNLSMASVASINSAGTTSLNATGNITADAITGVANIAIDGPAGVTVNDSITSTAGAVNLRSTLGDILQTTGTITAATTMGLHADALSISVTTLSSGGNLFMLAGTGVTVNNGLNTTVDGTIDVTAQSGAFTMASGAEINAAGAVTIVADTTATIDSLDAAGNVDVDADSTITINEALATTAGGTVDLTSASAGIAMAASTLLSAAGDTTLTAATTIVTDVVTVAGELVELAGGAIAAHGDITTTDSGNVTVTSSSSTFTQSSGTTITSAGTTTINATAATVEKIDGTGAVTTTASGALTLHDEINTTAGPVTVTATSGAFTMSPGAEIHAAGATTIDSGTVTTIGLIDAAGNIDVDAGTSITINEAVATTADGTVDLDAGSFISMATGTQIVAEGDTTLNAGTTITAQAITVDGDLSMTAPGAIAAQADILTLNGGTTTITSSGSTFTQSAGTTLNSNGAVAISAADVTLETITAAAPVVVTSSSDIDLNEAINTSNAGTVTLTATSGAFTMTSDASINAAGATDIDAGTSAWIDKLDAHGNVSVEAGTAITINEALATTGGGTVSLDAGTAIVMPTGTLLSADGDTTLTAGLYINTQTVTVAGDLSMTAVTGVVAAGDITTTALGTTTVNLSDGDFTQASGTTLTSAGAVTITADNANIETITASAPVAVTADDSIAVNEAINTSNGGTVTLVATSGSFAMTSDAGIYAAGAVSIDADTSATIDVIDAAGNIDIDAGTEILVNEAVATSAAGTVDLSSTTSSITMASGTNLSASGAATLTAFTTITTQTLSAASLTMTGGQAVLMEGDVTTTAGGATIASNAASVTMAAGTQLSASGAVEIDAETTVDLRTVDAAGAVDVEAGGAITIHDGIATTAGGAVSVDGDSIAMASGAYIVSAGTTHLNGDTTVVLHDLTSAGDLRGTAGTTMTLNGQIITTDDASVALTATSGALTMAAGTGITADSDVDLTSGTTMTVVDIAAAGNVTAHAGSLMTLNGTIGTTADGHVTLDVTNGAIAMASTASIDASGDATLTASDTISASDIVADGEVSITGGAAISLTGAIVTQNGPVTVLSQNGAITMVEDTSITSGAAATLSAAGDISAETISAAGKVTIAAGDGVALNNLITTTGGAMVAVSADDGSIAMLAPAAISSAGAVTFTASDDISTLGIAAGDDVTLTAGASLTVGDDIASGGTILIESQDGSIIVLTGATIAADADVDMQSAGAITARIVQAQGNVTMNADGAIILQRDVLANTGTLSLTSNSGAVTMASGMSLTAHGVMTVYASTTLLLQTVNAGDDATFTSGETANFDGAVTASGNLLINAGGDLSAADGATFAAGKGIMLQSGGAIATDHVQAVDGVIYQAVDNVNLNDDVVVTSGGVDIRSDAGSIAMASGTSITASNGSAVLTAQTTLALETITAKGVTLTSSGGTALNGPITTTGDGAVSIEVGGVLEIADAANISSDGDVSISAAGGVVTSANIVTADGAVVISSPLTLADNVAISTGRRGVNGITFDGSINGAYALTLRSGNDISFNGAVGQSQRLTAVNILGARNVALASTITAGQITQDAGTGTTTIAGTVAATGAGVSINNVGVRVTGALGTSAGVPIALAGKVVRVARTGRVWAGGKAQLTGAELVLENGNKVGVANGADLVLTGDKIDLGNRADSIAGTGYIVLQPLSAETSVSIGAAGTGFELSADELGTLAVGFKKVIIGRGQDADFDSGNVGGHAVTVGDISFRAPVSIRTPGAAGSISVTGALTTQGKSSNVWLTAGGDVAVHGAVKVLRSGHVFVTADADGDRRGAVRIAGSSDATVSTPSGNVMLVGPAVRIGGARSFASIVSGNSSVFIGTTATRSTVAVVNPRTVISGKDFLVGGTGRAMPVSVSLEGNISATQDLIVYSDADLDAANTRMLAGERLSLIADNDVNASNASLISRNVGVSIRPDADKDGAGTAKTTDVRISQPTSMDLRARLSEVSLPTRVIVAGDRGDAFVVIGNNSKAAVSGLVTVYVYASTDGSLDATDKVIGVLRQRVDLAGGATTTVKLKIQLPANLPAGQYRVIAEAMPYASAESAVGSNVHAGGTVDVAAA